ncbi:unnamed protein product [Didymodactylos carnosus]|uniref:Uncharacterized protein n=1 Tax=Didymodactylos carnosus TaxID=1234261 RepID=A0A814I4J2_9BILA|nr:unnamed protein product [Didymodactylos carnosus]CAF3790125.1 unnamed protein product [Didymodactylos carnosus]
MDRDESLLHFMSTVCFNIPEKKKQEISQIWLFGLKNAFFDVTKYIIDDNRILLLLQDRSQVFEIKHFRIQQDRRKEAKFDDQPYCGKVTKVRGCMIDYTVFVEIPQLAEEK